MQISVLTKIDRNTHTQGLSQHNNLQAETLIHRRRFSSVLNHQKLTLKDSLAYVICNAQKVTINKSN